MGAGINLQRNVIPLINFYKLLCPTRETEELCYNNSIIVKNNDEKVAFMVDEVTWVIDIDPPAIQQVDSQATDKVTRVINVKDKLVSVIDLEALFSENEG